MTPLSEQFPYALWITAPLFCIAAASLVCAIMGVVRLLKQSLIKRVPLVESQIVEFAEAGPLILCLEGPLFTRRFAWLKYRLEQEDGTPVPMRRRWFPAKTSGMGTVRMELRRFDLPAPGRYVLHVDNLEHPEPAETADQAKNRFAFMRPHLLRSLVFVVGITLSSVVLIASLVLSLLWISGT